MTPVWRAPHSPGPLAATVTVPGSKSLTARALYLAATAKAPTTLSGVLESRDTRLFSDALRLLGARITTGDNGTTVMTPLSGGASEVSIDCGLAGTVMRFIPPLAALVADSAHFDGDEAARRRPLAPLLRALESLGARIEFDGDPGHLPFTLRGPLTVPEDGVIRVDASASSQFLSALLLVAPLLGEPVTVSAAGAVVSLPHVEMTCESMRRRGIGIRPIDDNGGPARSWRVQPGRGAGGDVVIEPDLSNAGPFLAAAMVCSGSVTICGWPQSTTQAGDAFRDILTAMGARVRMDGTSLTVNGPGAHAYRGIDIDMSDIGELAPTIAALAALADSPSHLRGIAHLRGHETDRIAALATELTRIGAGVVEHEDGLDITPAPLHPDELRAYDDHRMATFAAIIGLGVDGVTCDDIDTTSKTLPGFARMWDDMLSQTSGA